MLGIIVISSRPRQNMLSDSDDEHIDPIEYTPNCLGKYAGRAEEHTKKYEYPSKICRHGEKCGRKNTKEGCPFLHLDFLPAPLAEIMFRHARRGNWTVCTTLFCNGHCARGACLTRAIREWDSSKAPASSTDQVVVELAKTDMAVAVSLSQKLARLVADIDYKLG